ncbi:AslA Arylsulfatase A and related enzymes [Acidimicrobiia bacterium]
MPLDQPAMNLLFITLDQFRGDCLSSAGHPIARTPNLDDLARFGVRFARHYSQAAPCAPGRACLYTGTYQMNNRVVMNGSPLDARFDNVALAAGRAGYDPVLFGYTDQAVDPRVVSSPEDPRLFTYEGVLPGFRVELDLTADRSAWVDHVRAAGWEMPDDPDEGLATESDRPAEVGISAFLTDRFLEWLPQQSQPWFAHLSHLRPHPPFAAAGKWSEAFDPADMDMPIAAAEKRHPLHEFLVSNPITGAPKSEDELRTMRAQYFGMIGDVDEQLGRVWDALRRSGQWENTIVVVTADHGEQLGDHGLQQKFGWFEQSYFIPAIIRDPRFPLAHGSVIDHFTENVDIFPTICDALDIEIPKQCDGMPLTDFLHGDTSDSWRDGATWEFDWRFFAPGGDGSGWPMNRESAQRQLTVRRTNEAAYVQFADGEAMLFDLAADPDWKTLSDDPASLLQHAQALLAWRAQNADRTLTGRLLHP